MDLVVGINKGQWRQSALATPLSLLPGDTLEVTANQTIVQKRGGNIVAQSAFGMPGAAVAPSSILSHQMLSSLFFYQEQVMPGVIETLTSVNIDPSGTIRFGFDGTELEFTNLAAALESVEGIDTTPSLARQMLVLKTLRNSPDGTNLENMLGGSCSIDFQASTPVVVTPPQ